MSTTLPPASLLGISEREQEVIDLVPASIAVLDTSGTIVSVNAAWRQFGLDNGRGPLSSDLGRRYADVIRRPAGLDLLGASDVADGVSRVLLGANTRFTTIYNCAGPEGDRWFRMVVLRAGVRSGRPRVLVVHRRQQDAPGEEDVLPTADELALRWVGFSMRCAWCGLRARNVLGEWVPADEALPTLLLSHGICPSCYDVEAGGARA
jgi:hypothetical protein